MKRRLTFYFLAATLSIAAGCGILSKRGNARKVQVSGKMLIENPVCDPNAAEKGGLLPMANATYYIKNGKVNNPDSIAFEPLDTDAEGRFKVKLAPGDYAVVHRDKLMSFGEFRLKYASNKSTYFKVRDDECFQRWYQSADFLLHVASDTSGVELVAKSRCFIKTNPCIEYTGPK